MRKYFGGAMDGTWRYNRDNPQKKDSQIGGLLPIIKTAVNYANKGSHGLQAHCQTEVHKKKVKVIALTHNVASTFPPSRETATFSETVAIIGRGGQRRSLLSGGLADARSSPSPTIVGPSRETATFSETVAIVRLGFGGWTDGRSLVTLTPYKAANIEN